MVTKERTNNQVILEQACSWPMWEGSLLQCLLMTIVFLKTHVWFHFHLSVETGAGLRIWGTKWRLPQTYKTPLQPPASSKYQQQIKDSSKNMFYFANTQGEQVTCVRWKSDSGGLLFGRKLTFEMPPQFQIPRVYVQIGFSHSIVGKGRCWPLQRWNSADFQRGSKVFFGWPRTCRLQTLLQRCLPRQQRYWISWY